MNTAWRARAVFHFSRWIWVLGLAVLTEVSFPSSSTDIGPLLDPGAVADRDVIAPFNFVVNKTDAEIEREGADLAASVKPIYQFDQRMYDSATTRASRSRCPRGATSPKAASARISSARSRTCSRRRCRSA